MNTKETKKNIIPNGLPTNWCLYRHVRLDKNEPFYIGVGKDKARPSSKKCRNYIWRSIVAKTDYEVEVLFEGLSKKKAIEKEIEFIALYGRKDLKSGILANMTSGGEGVNDMIYTEERNYKISKTLTGVKHSTERVRANILSKKNRLPVTINSINYPSLRQAAKALGIHRNTLKSRYLNKAV